MQSQLGTMVINSDEEDQEEDGTMKSKFHFILFRFHLKVLTKSARAVEKNQKTKTKTVKGIKQDRKIISLNI